MSVHLRILSIFHKPTFNNQPSGAPTIKKREKMKIRLTIDLPINKNCGAFKGVVFTVTGKPKEISRGRLIYFIGKNGERCGAFSNEYEVVNE